MSASRISSIALGLLVGWQFVYTPLCNVLEMHTELTAVIAARKGLHAWGEMTGTEQNWVMFTTETKASAFIESYDEIIYDTPALREGFGTVHSSPFEPEDPDRSIRLPFVHNRTFNFDANLTLLYQERTREDFHRFRTLPPEEREWVEREIRDSFLRHSFYIRRRLGKTNLELIGSDSSSLSVHQYLVPPVRFPDGKISPPTVWRYARLTRSGLRLYDPLKEQYFDAEETTR